jgi:hypothetical protein
LSFVVWGWNSFFKKEEEEKEEKKIKWNYIIFK